MFKKTAIFSTLILGCAVSCWLFKLLYISQKDRDRYAQMMARGKTIARVSQNQESQQQRLGVRKDLWLAQEDKSRLHHCILSQTSLLTLLPVDDKVDIVEHLQNLHCWMQDKLYPDTQQVRYFEAEQGLYQYSIQKFTASRVALSLFRLPGSQLPSTIDPKKAFLRGVAQDVSFAIAGKATQFQAEQFKATLATQKGEQQ